VNTARSVPPVALVGLLLGALCSSGCALFGSSEPPPPRVELDILAGELSGITRMAEGYLVAEDELVGSVLFVPGPTFEEGRLETKRAQTTSVRFERSRRSAEPFTKHPRLWPVQDVEALASDRLTAAFVLGSHQSKRGERRPDREFLLGLEWRPDDRELRLTLESREQRNLIARLDEAMQHACETDTTLCIRLVGDAQHIDARLNLEGLAYDPGDRDLYLGLRGPRTVDGHAIVVRMPVGTAFAPEPVAGAQVLVLDLEGGGVTGLAWDGWRDRLLVLAGPEQNDPKVPSSLFVLEPNHRQLERLHTFPLELTQERGRPEGIEVTRDDGLWIVFDRPARKSALWHYPELWARPPDP
jgi:hypothetical protein